MRKLTLILAAVAAIGALTSCAVLNNFKDRVNEIIMPESSAEPVSEEKTGTNTAETINDITVGVVDFDTFNPLTTTSSTVKDVTGFIYEPLFTIDEKLRAIPMLAEDASVNAAGMEVTVRLKQGVRWHDGTELTAADVVYTIERICAGETTYTAYGRAVSSVGKTDNYTVVISLHYPMPDIKAMLSFPIVKRGTPMGIDADYKPVGTGPFKFSSRDDDGVRLNAYAEHFTGPPLLDGINVLFIDSHDKYLTMFNANVTDFATSEQLDMTSFMPKGNSRMTDFTSNTLVFAGFNTQNAKLADYRTRRAISMLIDRETIVTHIYLSRAKAVEYALNPDSHLYFDTRQRMRLEESAALEFLAQAGWKTDSRGVYYRAEGRGVTYLTLTITVNGESAERVGAAETIAERLNVIGIKTQIKKCGAAEFNAAVSSGGYEMFIGETELISNGSMVSMVQSGQNVFGFGDAETDALLAQMGTVTDEENLKAVAVSLYEKIREKTPFAPICFKKSSVVTGAKLKSDIYPSVGGYVRATEKWSVME